MLDSVLDLVLPRQCVGCRRPDPAGWCPACRPGDPALGDALGFPLAAAGSYTGGARAAVLAYKERGRRDLARPLAAALAAAVRMLDPPPGAVLVPMPSRAAARRARGGDHLARLARRAGRATGRTAAPALRLTRSTRDSAGLDAPARRANLAGAMTARAPRGPAAAVLVDDVATTGATLTEAARALRHAGWTVCGAAVIAVTPRQNGPDQWRLASHGSSVGET